MEAPEQLTSDPQGQLPSSAALELLSICLSIGPDGRIAEEEIRALRHWSTANIGNDIPAIRFLHSTLERVRAAGIITTRDRQSIARLMETFLPPTDRRYATALYRHLDLKSRQRLWQDLAKARQNAGQQRPLNRPIHFADFIVAGTRHHNRAAIITETVKQGSPAYLRREWKPALSEWSVAVLNDRGECIGYVPEDEALDIAPLLDNGALHSALIKKVLHFETGIVPVVTARLFEAQAPNTGAISQEQLPAYRPSAASLISPPTTHKQQHRRVDDSGLFQGWSPRWGVLLFVLVFLFIYLDASN
jgi:hypothetical protein